MELETGKNISEKLRPGRFETTAYVVDKDHYLTLPRGRRILCSWNSPSNFSFLGKVPIWSIPFNYSSVTQEGAQLQAENCLAIVKQKARKEMPVYKSFMVVRKVRRNKDIQLCEIA